MREATPPADPRLPEGNLRPATDLDRIDRVQRSLVREVVSVQSVGRRMSTHAQFALYLLLAPPLLFAAQASWAGAAGALAILAAALYGSARLMGRLGARSAVGGSLRARRDGREAPLDRSLVYLFIFAVSYFGSQRWWIGPPFAAAYLAIRWTRDRARSRGWARLPDPAARVPHIDAPPRGPRQNPSPSPALAGDVCALELVAAVAVVDWVRIRALSGVLGMSTERCSELGRELADQGMLLRVSESSPDPALALSAIGRTSFEQHVAFLARR